MVDVCGHIFFFMGTSSRHDKASTAGGKNCGDFWRRAPPRPRPRHHMTQPARGFNQDRKWQKHVSGNCRATHTAASRSIFFDTTQRVRKQTIPGKLGRAPSTGENHPSKLPRFAARTLHSVSESDSTIGSASAGRGGSKWVVICRTQYACPVNSIKPSISSTSK